jgi:hypothetical protein
MLWSCRGRERAGAVCTCRNRLLAHSLSRIPRELPQHAKNLASIHALLLRAEWPVHDDVAGSHFPAKEPEHHQEEAEGEDGEEDHVDCKRDEHAQCVEDAHGAAASKLAQEDADTLGGALCPKRESRARPASAQVPKGLPHVHVGIASPAVCAPHSSPIAGPRMKTNSTLGKPTSGRRMQAAIRRNSNRPNRQTVT